MQSIGNECGVTHNTVKSWLSVLQVSGIIKLLRPWHANVSKRLVKSPKLYFLDTGLACFLLGIQKPEHLQGHPLRGALFETFVVSEAYKQHDNAGLPEQLWFCRDSNQTEVDLLMGLPGNFDAVEIKSGMTVSSDYFKGLSALDQHLGGFATRSVIYGGKKSITRQQTRVIPWERIAGLFVEEKS